jgi:cyclic pyranopterin phosphate synthase
MNMDVEPMFTHLDPDGYARMVGVGHKPDMRRHAEAMGFIRLNEKTLQALRDRTIPKGDVLTVARIAGIQAAKKTSDLIPLAHPLSLHGIEVEFAIEGQGVRIVAAVDTTGKTGVEMEALTAVAVTALTIYDMCKAVDKGMVIEDIALMSKTKSPLDD